MYCVKLPCRRILKIERELETVTLSRTFTYLSIWFRHTARMSLSSLPVLFSFCCCFTSSHVTTVSVDTCSATLCLQKYILLYSLSPWPSLTSQRGSSMVLAACPQVFRNVLLKVTLSLLNFFFSLLQLSHNCCTVYKWTHDNDWLLYFVIVLFYFDIRPCQPVANVDSVIYLYSVYLAPFYWPPDVCCIYNLADCGLYCRHAASSVHLNEMRVICWLTTQIQG